MHIQIFPNWFKKLSLIVFLFASFLAGADDFLRGYSAGYNGSLVNYTESKFEDFKVVTNMLGGKNIIHLLEILAVLALISYMLSKEKVEDDYINILRLESYQLSFLVISVTALLFHTLHQEFFYGVYDSVSLFVWLYLIIFYFKKRLA